MIEYEMKEEQRFEEIWNFCNFWNSKQKFEIPALLQGGTICLRSFSSKKIQNDRIRTEGEVAF